MLKLSQELTIFWRVRLSVVAVAAASLVLFCKATAIVTAMHEFIKKRTFLSSTESAEVIQHTFLNETSKHRPRLIVS